MEIRKCFEQETIAEQEVFLTDDEEAALFVELQKLMQMQLNGEEESEYSSKDATDLAGLAFVAGRAYQRQVDNDLVDLRPTEEVNIESFDGILLSKEAVTTLIEAQGRVINILLED